MSKSAHNLTLACSLYYYLQVDEKRHHVSKIIGGYHLMMHTKRMFIKKNSLNAGLILLYVLPPFGIAWLLFLGLREFYRTIQRKLHIPYNLMTLFFIVLFISSVGATLRSKEPAYILSALMILCSFGLYLYTLHNIRFFKLKTYFWISIGGGLYIFIFGKLISSLHDLGISQNWTGYLTGGKLLGYDQHNRLYGSTYNPNYASFLLLLSLAFLLTMCIDILQKRNYKRVVPYFFFAACLIAGIVDTGSRTGFFTMLFLIAVFLYRFNWRIFLAVFSIALLNLKNLYQWMPRHMSLTESMDTRLTIWKHSIHIFEKNPSFGVTPFGFDHAYEMLTGKDVPHPHNIFLAIFSDFGFLSGILFIAVILLMTYHMIRFLKYREHSKQFFNAFILSLPIIFFTGLLDFPLSSPQIALPTIILLSLWHRYLTMHMKINRKSEWRFAILAMEIETKKKAHAN